MTYPSSTNVSWQMFNLTLLYLGAGKILKRIFILISHQVPEFHFDQSTRNSDLTKLLFENSPWVSLSYPLITDPNKNMKVTITRKGQCWCGRPEYQFQFGIVYYFSSVNSWNIWSLKFGIIIFFVVKLSSIQ